MNLTRPKWLEQVERVLETLNEGVLIADASDRVIFVNSVFTEMTGVPPHEAVGQDALQLFCRPQDYGRLLALRERTEQEGRSRQEFLLPTRGGGELPVVVSVGKVRDVDGQHYAIATCVDISEQDRTQKALRSAYASLEKRQKETEKELRLAARVQQSLTPKPLEWGALCVDTFFQPTQTIGGDFGMIVPIAGEHLNLLVCDVVGHGISSALLANRIYTEANTLVRNRTALSDTLRQLNTLAIQDIGNPGFFFTVASARIEHSGRHMVFAGAGHPPAMLVTPGAEPRLLNSQSMILGAIAGVVNNDAEVTLALNPGDRLVLYTDGATDVFDSHGEILGVEGLKEIVRQTSCLPFHQMKGAILGRIAAWLAGPLVDDMSLMLVEIR